MFLYLAVILYPIFFVVIVSMIAGRWLVTSVKREERHRRGLRHIRSGTALKLAPEKRTMGAQVLQGVWLVLSGIAWVAVAFILSFLILMLFHWQFYWTEIFG